MKRAFGLVGIVVCLAASLVMTCERKPMERKVLLERVQDVAVLQLYADGLERLSPKEKIFAYYLYKAAVAGRDICYDQNHKDALEIRDLLEGIVTHPAGIPKEVLEPILTYAKLFWIHNGPYNTRTFRKFVLAVSEDAFLHAARIAQNHGADLGLRPGETLDAKLQRLRRVIFDPNDQPLVANKNPGPGLDIITGSANNFYENVTLQDLAHFPEKYPLNSKVVKVDNVITELVYRAGSDDIPAGLYAQELQQVIENLQKALPYTSEKQQAALRHLIRFFQTGDPEDFRQYNIAWVQDDPTVDTINGFIEVYKDARGAKGEYEALVGYRHEEMTAIMKQLAAHAQYFEDRAPWRDQYKRRGFQIPVANAIDVLTETGGAGPISWSGINLPNEQALREKYGSKSFLLINIMKASQEAIGSLEAREFAATDEERELEARYGWPARLALVAMHEVLGHASGKASEKLKDDPSTYLREYYSTLEEARADLVALWNFFDDKLLQLGVIPDKRCGEAAYHRYVRSDLTQLRRVTAGDQFEEDHDRATHLIVNYLRDRTEAIETLNKDGKLYLQVQDVAAMRHGVGELLAELMRIKAEGDYNSAKALIDRYGIKFNPEWRDQVVKRAKEIGLPNFVAYCMPKLTPVTDSQGNVIDVKIRYPMDFTAQMLEYSKESRVRKTPGSVRETKAK